MDKFDSAADKGRSMLTGELTKAPVTSTKDNSSRTLWAVSCVSLIAIASLSAVLYADRTRIAQLEHELASTHSILNRPEVMNRVMAMTVSGSGSSTSSSSTSVHASGSKSSSSSSSISYSGSKSGSSTSSSSISASGHSSGSSSSSISASGSKSGSTSVEVDKSSTTIEYSSNNSGKASGSYSNASFEANLADLKIDQEVINDFSDSLHDTLERLDARITAIGNDWNSQSSSITIL